MCNIAHCVGLCYFVARQFLSKIYALLSVTFPGLKICECKKNDKYQVCTAPTANSRPRYFVKHVFRNICPQLYLSIPDICHFFYTHIFWGLEILHLKVRKFATKIASRQNSVIHHSVQNHTHSVKLHTMCKIHTLCKITHCVKLHTLCKTIKCV